MIINKKNLNDTEKIAINYSKSYIVNLDEYFMKKKKFYILLIT